MKKRTLILLAAQFVVLMVAMLIFVDIGRADPLDTWTWRNPLSTDTTLNGITYRHGQFLAVGDHGAILTSVDGISWVQRGSETNIPGLRSVAYGNGKFVALGNGQQQVSTVVTSVDGVYWAPQGEVWYDFVAFGLAYGDSRFVAVGEDTGPTTLLTSADGVSWERDAFIPTSWGIAYGNGQFVAVGIGTIVTCTDGTNWAPCQSGTQNLLYGIAYGKGQFVAVGDAGTILSSADGTNWVMRQSGTQNILNDIAYGNGEFVAVSGWGNIEVESPESGTDGTTLTSADGVNWDLRQGGTTNTLNRITYGNGRFVAVGHHGTILASGRIISLLISPDVSSGRLALFLEGPTGLSYTIQSSTDLISWRSVTNITSSQPGTVILDALPPGSGHVFYRARSQ